MLRPLLVFLVLAAILVGVLVLTGTFDETPPLEGDSAPVPTAPGAAELGTTQDPIVGRPEPSERPALEPLALSGSARVLLISRRQTSWNQFVINNLSDIDGVAFQSWMLNASADAGAGAKGMDPLDSAPTADLLDVSDYDVLIVDNVQLEDLPNEFWETVDRRVRAQQMGLWFQAGLPISEPGSDATGPQTVNSGLTHPVLSKLLPVAAAKPIEGEPAARPGGMRRVPGVFQSRQVFHVTDAGSSHPATRLVPWKRWSRESWAIAGHGEHGLGTLFCYPVTKLTEGSQTLLQIEPEGQKPIPAVILGNPEAGRVLWIGVPELGWKSYYRSDRTLVMGVVVRNWITWLTGKAAWE